MGALNVSENKKRKTSSIDSNSNLQNIRSKYIIQKMLYNLTKLKKLYIIKYNKYFQKRLNLNINDYKEYSEIYTLIEIEIKPSKRECKKFINIPEKEELFYHIYFNNSEKEINRNYIKENDKIKNIKIIIDYQVKSFSGLFQECDIEYINFKKN